MNFSALDTDIWLPCVAMVGLTAVVWTKAVIDRVGEIRKRRIHPQLLARPNEVAERLSNTTAMDNFANLFQLPVLFYVLCVALASTQNATPIFVAAAWVFVALRVVHSIVQSTYNRVMHRFAIWVLGAVWLFSMWGGFLFQRLAG